MKYWKNEKNKALIGIALDLFEFIIFTSFAIIASTIGATIVSSALLFLTGIDIYNNFTDYKIAKDNFETCKNNHID